MSLDYRYFDLVHTQAPTFSMNRESMEYQVYQPTYSTMVLYSKVNGAPLAAVSLKTAGSSTAKAAIMRRPTLPDGKAAPLSDDRVVDFQGLLDRDHQRFAIVISNLSHLGTVKIDVMKNNTAVNETDPGPAKGGLNNVNELHPLQSYSIEGDQKDSRALILSSVRTATGATVTTKEAETNPTALDPANRGTYYYLAVTPRDNSPELIKLFADTYWNVADVIVTFRNKEPPRSVLHAYDYAAGDTFDDEEASEEHSEGTMTLCSLENTRGPVLECASISPQPALKLSRPKSADVFAASVSTASVSARKKSLVGYPASAAEDEVMAAASNRSITKGEAIDNSLAAKVDAGELVHTGGNKTGYSYVYNVPSNQTGKLCCLGLSVAPGLIFYPRMPNLDAVQAGQIIIKELQAKGAQAILAQVRVFPHDHCVVCLDDDTKPSLIFCLCGHQCCCAGCAQKLAPMKCPICRGHISAMLKN